MIRLKVLSSKFVYDGKNNWMEAAQRMVIGNWYMQKERWQQQSTLI